MIQRVEAGRELSHGAIADLGATLSDQVARGVTGIHLNTSRVVDFDSLALESLMEFNDLARSRGLHFVIIEPSELLTTALTITALKDKLDIQRSGAD